jgi:hypothetical protein
LPSEYRLPKNNTLACNGTEEAIPLEDLIDIAAHLPWKAGLVLALIAYLGFHYAASQPMVRNIAPVDQRFASHLTTKNRIPDYAHVIRQQQARSGNSTPRISSHLIG